MQTPDSTAVRPPGPKAKACNYCEQNIIWTVTAKAERMPVDALPSASGNVLVRVAQGVTHGVVIGRASMRNAMRANGVELRTHHRLSCPRATEWSGRYK